MESCQVDTTGSVICNACGTTYQAEGNRRSLSVPPGSGGCKLVYKCPKCQSECCGERDKPAPKLEPEQKPKKKNGRGPSARWLTSGRGSRAQQGRRGNVYMLWCRVGSGEEKPVARSLDAVGRHECSESRRMVY